MVPDLMEILWREIELKFECVNKEATLLEWGVQVLQKILDMQRRK